MTVGLALLLVAVAAGLHVYSLVVAYRAPLSSSPTRPERSAVLPRPVESGAAR